MTVASHYVCLCLPLRYMSTVESGSGSHLTWWLIQAHKDDENVRSTNYDTQYLRLRVYSEEQPGEAATALFIKQVSSQDAGLYRYSVNYRNL